MPTEIIMRKERGRLVPVDAMSAEDLDKVPAGKDLRVTVAAPRKTSRQNRYVWALAGKIAEARDDIPDKDAAMDVLCELARHVDVTVNPITGGVHVHRRSIANLDQAEMSRLIDRMIYVACTQIVPGLNEGALRREIEAMVAPAQDRRLDEQRRLDEIHGHARPDAPVGGRKGRGAAARGCGEPAGLHRRSDHGVVASQ